MAQSQCHVINLELEHLLKSLSHHPGQDGGVSKGHDPVLFSVTIKLSFRVLFVEKSIS